MDTSITENWQWATETPGFDLNSHRIMLKVSGFGTSVQHYGEVDFKPPPPHKGSAAVRVEMLRSIKTAIKQSVLIPVSNRLPLAVATVLPSVVFRLVVHMMLACISHELAGIHAQATHRASRKGNSQS